MWSLSFKLTGEMSFATIKSTSSIERRNYLQPFAAAGFQKISQDKLATCSTLTTCAPSVHLAPFATFAGVKVTVMRSGLLIARETDRGKIFIKFGQLLVFPIDNSP